MKKLSVLTAALLVTASSVAFAASELSTASGAPVTTQGNVAVSTTAGAAQAAAEPAKPAKATKAKKAKGKKAKKKSEAAH